MTTQLDLKQIEKKAFRSTYQDGMWDIYYGLIVMCMAFFLYHPQTGFTPWNIVQSTLSFVVAYILFWAGKRYITLPRMGQVVFGEVRKKRNRILAIILGVFIALQVILVIFTATGWFSREFIVWLQRLLGGRSSGLLLVASISSLIVGISMLTIVHFTDFPRGYYVALLMALAVFLMVFINQPIWPLLIGLAIILPGVYLLIRFLRRYPLHPDEADHD